MTYCLQVKKSKSTLSNLLDVNTKEFRKIIIYTPTFKSVRKWDNQSEIDQPMQNYFYFNDFNEKELNNYLINENTLLIIKPHWADQESYNTTDKHSSNIVFLYDKVLSSKGYQFYEFFKFFDVMLTDYSSIFVDYLLLNRPIIYIHSTESDYKNKRGFILNDNVTQFMPGDKVKNQQELIHSLNQVLHKPINSQERERIISLFHKYIDGKSCDRVYEIMKMI